MAKHVKKWVEGCEQCARDKRVPNATITPELLNLPEWDLGPEDAMQIDLLPNLPPSGGYENVLTAIDVFSRYLFAYPLTDASAINVAKALIDIMTKHAYLPTTLITDKGTAFTSTIIAEVTQILGITLKCATTKHPQTIGKLERTHASLKTNLKMACGEYRRQWHKYLPLAVLNHNTSYHASIGCEPTRVFHGRIPYNILDHKLGNNPNEKISPTTEFAEGIQNRTKTLIDKTKQNIMQSYIKYKEYYDRKAKAAPLKENEFCFVLQPKADHQGSKIPFRDYRWVGPFIVQKVLPNENYIVRRLNTNKTQILHRIRLKKFVPNQPLEDNFREQRLQPDEEIVIPQDDLYIITWETDFGEQLTTRDNEAIPTSLPNGEQPSTTQINNDANESDADYIITRETNKDNTAHSRNDRLSDNVTTRNEIPPALWNACDYMIQFNFVIAHIPGAQNTAADYLSRLEADPKDKLVMKIREDVQTLPIEINVQSSGVSQEEQIFYTNDDDETEEQYWARKEAIRTNPVIEEPTVTIQTLSTNLVKQQPDIQVSLRKTNQIIIEQSKDAVLQQLKAKLLHEDYSENILHQDARYRHYANNMERIALKDEILTRQYFDETGNVKYHQILLPQHLLRELLQSLHGTAHKHPGISK